MVLATECRVLQVCERRCGGVEGLEAATSAPVRATAEQQQLGCGSVCVLCWTEQHRLAVSACTTDTANATGHKERSDLDCCWQCELAV